MDITATLRAARELHRSGRTIDAEEAYQRILEVDPDNIDALHLVGVLAHQRGQHEEAVALIGRAQRQHCTELAKICNNRGAALRALDRPKEALADFTLATEMDPEFADAFYNAGTTLYLLERFDESAQALQRAVTIEPGLVEGHFNLGTTLGRLRRYEQSDAALLRAIELNPRFPEAYCNLGSNRSAVGDYEAAVEYSRTAVGLRPDYKDAYYNLGNALSGLGDLDSAMAAYGEAVKLQPDFAIAYANMGNVLMKQGDADGALAAYRHAMTLAPQLSELPYHLGTAMLRQGKVAEALDAANDCLRIEPGNTRGLTLRVVALVEAGETEAAQALLAFDQLIRPVEWSDAPGFRSMAEFNSALAEHVLQHPSLTADPSNHATRYGMHSGELLSEPKGPMAALEKMIEEAVRDYRDSLRAGADHPFLISPPEEFLLTVWGVVMRAQGHQVPHNHPSAWLSGVYYPKVPSVVDADTQDHAGWIEFGQPPPDLECSAQHPLRIIKPEEGLMVLFPSYTYHRTIPYETTETRISIAFDVLRL